MSPSNPSSYRPDIDGLRAFAVTSVLLFHLGISYFPGGFVGVDIFFVISGFLITGIIKKEIDATGRFRFRAFYMRRLRRLFPALFVVLLLTAIAAVVILSPTHLSRFGGALSSVFASVSNIYFWNETDYFDVSTNVKPLLHTWSLSVEEQFYLFWPLLLLFLHKRQRASRIPILLILIGQISLAANIIYGNGGDGSWNEDGRSTIFFLLPFRVFEFVIGALLVWVVRCSLRSEWVYDVLFWVGVALMVYAVLTFNEEMLIPSFFGLAPCLGAALVIFSGNRAATAGVLTVSPIVGIGLLSYSLYLVHWPLIAFWQYLGSGELDGVDQTIIAALSVTLAYLSYSFIEKPFRTKRIDLALPVWRYSVAAASIFIVAVAMHMHESDGWTWRVSYPVDLRQVGDAKVFHKKFYGGAGYPYYGPVNTEKAADIVVIGDSHGRHYAEGIFKVIAQPNDFAFYNASGTSCFHLPDFTRITEGKDWDKLCPERLEKALSFVNGGKNPLVVISHSWVSQMPRGGITDGQEKRRDRKVTVDDLISGILALKDRIGDSPLVVIGQVPTTGGHNLYDILTRPRLLFFSAFDPEQYLTNEAIPNLVAFNAALRNAAEESGKFVFLDPHEVVCEDGICHNLDSQNHLIYSDGSHLSKYGSVEVIQGFLPQLLRALKDRKG